MIAPGRMPAMYSRDADVLVIDPYTMKATPGGIRLPRLAPAAMEPSTMRWS